MHEFQLKLYITGQTSSSRNALANLQGICESRLAGQYELTVIDVLEHPKLAEDDRIIATPTLIREFPTPIRRMIGDFSQACRLAIALGF